LPDSSFTSLPSAGRHGESHGHAAGAPADATADGRIALPDGGAVPIGLKLGSTRTVLAYPAEASGLQVVRTLTCLASYEEALTGEKQYRFGDDAAAEYPDRVEFVLRSGLPEDEQRLARTATFFQTVLDSHDVPADSVVVYATPVAEEVAGFDALRTIVEQSSIGTRRIEGYPELLCSSIPALGTGLEAIEETFVALNLGSTHLEAAAYRRGEQLTPLRTGAVSGNEVDREIINNVENETQGRVHLDIHSAREYKEQHADLESFEPFTDVIQQPGGGSHEFTIEWSVMDAVEAYLDGVVDRFAETFLPQLANGYGRVSRTALDRPVVLTGGMACIPGIVEEFEQRVGERLDRDIEATAPERADLAAAVGAQRIAANLA
jgi:hypothetical protein